MSPEVGQELLGQEMGVGLRPTMDIADQHHLELSIPIAVRSDGPAFNGIADDVPTLFRFAPGIRADWRRSGNGHRF